MSKSMSASVSRSRFILLAVAFLGLGILGQQIYFSERVRAASSTIVISEVDADTPLAGTDTANEWFELQNVSAGNITLTNWTITDNGSSDTIPSVTIGPGGHVIVAATAAGFASEHPGFTGTVLTIGDGAIGNGLANAGDELTLKDSSAVAVDGLSWGSNTTVLNPAAGVDSPTNTNQRNAAGMDTDTAADWTRATETPNGSTNFPPTPTNPTGVGAANPSPLLAGSQTLLTVTVTPGSNPASTALNVSGNLSSIGGAATQQFFDDGTNGDKVAGNNVFSYSVTVSVATPTGAKTIPFSITDAQSRSGSGNISLTVAAAEHMLMGNPSNAIADESMPTNYLMLKPQYALSYNNDKGTSNWTSWHLDSTWTTGVADRQDDFRSDDTLPLSFKHVSNGYQFATYGFQRGHMCPSADRTSSVADNSATFLMTNMVPQAPGNNQGPWGSMEDYIRTQLNGTANELYIISGGSGIGGNSSTGHWDSIIDTAGNTVTVPHVTWKVVMVLSNATGDDVARVSTSTRTFAVIMPNDDIISPDQWQKYLATVDQVEALSNYNFYSNVPTAVQDVIEARLDAENDTPPVTSNQTVTTAKDQGVAVTLSATDFNVNNIFTYTTVAAPLHGSLLGSNGNLTYSPNPHYVGPDLFKFKANDGALDSNVSTVTIMVNESSIVQFSAAAYAIGESAGSATITVTRTGDTTGAAAVDIATSDSAGTQNCIVANGKASSRCDYITTVGTLRFATNEASKTIAIPIVDDSYAEGSEAFTVTLSNAAGAILGAPIIATVTINDNDSVNGSNPIEQANFFVREHYIDFLNREPDASGLAFWTNQITSCGTDQACIEIKRINVSAAFYLSIEFQQTGYLVERIYKAAYGDAIGTSTLGSTHQLSVPIVRLTEFLPDTQEIGSGVIVGQTGWEQVLENNKQAFTSEFVQRSRFTKSFPTAMTAAQFIDTLNANAGGPLSQSERNQLVSDLSTGAKTRAQVLRAVTEDPDLNNAEFNRAFVLMQYFGYLRRNPNDPQDTDYTGYDFWLTKLNQFNGNFVNAEMVKAFIVSSEYRQRFGP